MEITLVFILGTIVGSFLNVVILRYQTGLSITRGHSRCFSCGKNLKWFELMPVLSFIFLRGKCSSCKSKISIQYPLVELASGLLFAALFYKSSAELWGLNLLAVYLIVFSTLLVISVYDFRHKIIPDILVVIFIISSVFVAAGRFLDGVYFTEVARYLNLLAGIILFLPFCALWYFSDGRWIGLGDGKLAIGIGTLLSLPEGLSAIVLSFWVGAVFALMALFLKHFVRNSSLSKGSNQLTMKSELPFAPFLIMGTIIVFFFPIDIFSLHLFGL